MQGEIANANQVLLSRTGLVPLLMASSQSTDRATIGRVARIPARYGRRPGPHYQSPSPPTPRFPLVAFGSPTLRGYCT
jgi:hypothetical protein